VPQAVGGSLLYTVRNGTRGISIDHRLKFAHYAIMSRDQGVVDLALLLDKSVTSTSKTAPHRSGFGRELRHQ
jgi:hypothetical protein